LTVGCAKETASSITVATKLDFYITLYITGIREPVATERNFDLRQRVRNILAFASCLIKLSYIFCQIKNIESVQRRLKTPLMLLWFAIFWTVS